MTFPVPEPPSEVVLRCGNCRMRTREEPPDLAVAVAPLSGRAGWRWAVYDRPLPRHSRRLLRASARRRNETTAATVESEPVRRVYLPRRAEQSSTYELELTCPWCSYRHRELLTWLTVLADNAATSGESTAYLYAPG